MELQKNLVGWFEIPVTNMDRAIKFYETVLDFKLERQKIDDLDMALFPSGDLPGSPGTLAYHKDFHKPSTDGVLIYFTAQSGDLSKELSKVKSAGGKVLIEKKLITEDIGYMGLFIDTEGNRIAISSKK